MTAKNSSTQRQTSITEQQAAL